MVGKNKHSKNVKKAQKAERHRPEPRWKKQVKEIEEVVFRYDSMNPDEIETFSDIPLSRSTLDGLRKSGFCQSYRYPESCNITGTYWEGCTWCC